MPDSSLNKALKLTNEIFTNLEVEKYNYKGYELIWSTYGKVHAYYSIPYILKGKIPYHHKPNTLKRSILFSIMLLKDLSLTMYSIISILIIIIRNKRTTIIWTGDFYRAETKGDFRLNNLYLELETKNLSYIDFIRDNANGYKHTIKNMILRKRPAIYYNSMERLFTLYKNPNQKVFLKEENNLHREIMNNAIKVIATPDKINFFVKIFKVLKAKNLLCWHYSDRAANLIHAAKLANVVSIGFMHGAGMNSYSPHEYINVFNGQYKIGPDVEGVWSEWWKNKYESLSKIYKTIEVSGPLRKGIHYNKNSKKIKKIRRVLWISEPLVEPDEVIPYMRYLKENYDLTIKKRPYTNDKFYNKLISRFPDFKNVLTNDGDIYKAMQSFDLIIGSHSTGVLEASFLEIPLLFVDTTKWSNFFEVTDEFFVKDLGEIESKIQQSTNQNFEKIKLKYFGRDEDYCVNWLIKKIEKDL